MIGPAVLRGVMLLKYLGGREMSRPDDGGTEGPEQGAGGAKRRSPERGWGLMRGAVVPPLPSMGVWGLCHQKILQKINVEITHFQAFLQAKNKMVSICRVGKARTIRHSILT